MIAKNEEMKRVFGLGYPSRPVYTVEEFGERQAQLMRQQEKVGVLHLTFILPITLGKGETNGG